ncbi:acyltransferase [Methylomonas sp. LL1]|uniref:acyltransferase family protein n=1 Tax=Methylomonas sp. LL1 TaxID=2785785 RepID=UPI0018C44972|nr:acyltransferase [Methylomonas sp. LL1]QPK62729.1 acyltransferase [Methylomonas sp. LL1]
MKLYKLEALRGFAAIYVVLHHSMPHHLILGGIDIGALFRFGQESVILFFLLSGFVINYAYRSGSDKTFRTYFFKRLARIYIPLILIMVLGYSISCFRSGQLVDPELKVLILNLLMFQDIETLKPNTIINPYMNNSPLWSLSYEWWFYMLFFPIKNLLHTEKSQNIFVFSLAIFASILYTELPNFITRLLMYLSIWWTGVQLANTYLNGSAINFSAIRLPIISLSIICMILAIQIYLFLASGKSVSIGVHPFLELRHVLFASTVVVLAICWHKLHWKYFDALFKPFGIFAPVSYVIYISHYYFVTDANYLSFFNNIYVEKLVYFSLLLLFSYALELRIYPPLQRAFLSRALYKNQ